MSNVTPKRAPCISLHHHNDGPSGRTRTCNLPGSATPDRESKRLSSPWGSIQLSYGRVAPKGLALRRLCRCSPLREGAANKICNISSRRSFRKYVTYQLFNQTGARHDARDQIERCNLFRAENNCDVVECEYAV